MSTKLLFGINSSYRANQRANLHSRTLLENKDIISSVAPHIQEQGPGSCFPTCISMLKHINGKTSSSYTFYDSFTKYFGRSGYERVEERFTNANDLKELLVQRKAIALKSKGIASRDDTNFFFPSGAPATSRFSNKSEKINAFHTLVIVAVVDVGGKPCALVINPEEGGPRIHEIEKCRAITQDGSPLDLPQDFGPVLNKAMAQMEVWPVDQLVECARYSAVDHGYKFDDDGRVVRDSTPDGIYATTT